MTINPPAYQTALMLRAQIANDYNTTRDNINQMIWPGWPRKDLVKSSYPRISIIKISETGVAVAIGATTATENTYILQIDIWIWDKTKDPQLVTVDSNVVSGTRARSEIEREVLDELRNHIYTDTNTIGYYDYNVRASRQIPFDEDIGILRQSIEIEFKEIVSN